MKKEYLNIQGIPSILWGQPSEDLFLYIHGQHGCKEEAEAFAQIAARYGWQVLSIDLPEHGERKAERDAFNPWHVVPELWTLMDYSKTHWNKISLRANSIGAWFSLLSFAGTDLNNCLFVSPILDMHHLILNMMLGAGVSENRLQLEQTIPTTFGQTLSWEYLSYAKTHPITKWGCPTEILYGDKDDLTELPIVENFAKHFHCRLTIMENGEHWLHTQEQVKFLNEWTIALFENAV